MLEKKIKNFNILFLGGGKRVSIAKKFIASGNKLNLKVNLFSYELNRNVPFKIVGKVILGKKWSNKYILNDLEEIIRTKKISLLIACVDQATFLLPKINRLLKKRISITSDIKALNTVFDKEKMFYFFPYIYSERIWNHKITLNMFYSIYSKKLTQLELKIRVLYLHSRCHLDSTPARKFRF